MKQKKYYDELSIEILLFGSMDVLTFSGENDMKPEGDYDDGTGWWD